MKRVALLFAILLACAWYYGLVEEAPIPGEAINSIVREGGDPADIVLGAGLAPWISEKAGYLGQWMTGLPSREASQYRAGLREVVLDAQENVPDLASLVEDVYSLLNTSELHAAVTLIVWNENLDRFSAASREFLNSPYIHEESVAKLAAIQRARAHLPSAESLRLKMERLKSLPGAMMRNAEDWKRAAGRRSTTP